MPEQKMETRAVSHFRIHFLHQNAFHDEPGSLAQRQDENNQGIKLCSHVNMHSVCKMEVKITLETTFLASRCGSDMRHEAPLPLAILESGHDHTVGKPHLSHLVRHICCFSSERLWLPGEIRLGLCAAGRLLG